MAYSTLIDYDGVAIGAKEVNWHELDTLETVHRISSRPGKYLYLGNHFSAVERLKTYALFSDSEGTYYCVKLP